MTKKRKNIDLTEATIRTLTVAAAQDGTVFKLYVEQLLEEKARELERKKQ